MYLLDCSGNGADLTWQGAYSVTAGLVDMNNYQYGCLDFPVSITADGRYGVSVDSAKKDDPIPVWGRVHAPLYATEPELQNEFPCGEHIGDVSKILEL